MGELVPRIFGDVEGWLESTFGQLGVHPIRVEEFREQDRYVLRAEVPGIDPKQDVKVYVDRGMLTIEAKRSEERHEQDRSEFHYGAFRRSVSLPAGADESNVKARYENGILEIEIPLREIESSSGRSIAIEV